MASRLGLGEDHDLAEADGKKHLSENVTDYSQIFPKAGPQEQVLSGFSGTSTLSCRASQFSSLGV